MYGIKKTNVDIKTTDRALTSAIYGFLCHDNASIQSTNI